MPSTQVGTPNDYTYNGKELNDDFGLNLHDYGARWYDASIGRWNKTDRFSEGYKSYSPYAYVMNNPIKYMDVLGDTTAIYDIETGEFLETVYDDSAPNVSYMNSQLYGKFSGAASKLDKSSKSYVGKVSRLLNKISALGNQLNAKASELGVDEVFYSQMAWPTISDVLANVTYIPRGTADDIDGSGSVECADDAKWQAMQVKGVNMISGRGGAIDMYALPSQTSINVDFDGGLNLIFNQLNAGQSTVTGMDRYGDWGNVNKATSHFINIVGSGIDSNGAYLTIYPNNYDNPVVTEPYYLNKQRLSSGGTNITEVRTNH